MRYCKAFARCWKKARWSLRRKVEPGLVSPTQLHWIDSCNGHLADAAAKLAVQGDELEVRRL